MNIISAGNLNGLSSVCLHVACYHIVSSLHLYSPNHKIVSEGGSGEKWQALESEDVTRALSQVFA